tara:strand:- start:23376 stop:24092 length:717 start_codon:yes stop_codon:yes gene_type:complete
MWNLSAMVLGKETHTFDEFVNPNIRIIPPAPHPKLFGVTREFLKTANAQPIRVVLEYFFKWLNNHHDASEGLVVLVAHGNFRYDQPLLQAECIRSGVTPPSNLYFLDTLHWFRSIKKGRKSYSLNTLYKNEVGRDLRNAHLAIVDVKALNQLIVAQSPSLHGIMYQCYHTPLIRIPSVGQFTENLLYDQDINSLEALIFRYMQQHNHSQTSMAQELVQMNVRPCIATTIAQYVAGLAY